MTEYLAENSRLRQLSRRYAEGQLAFEDYRAGRRAIIEALEAGQVQAEEPVPEPVPAPDATGIRLPDDTAVFYKTLPPRASTDAGDTPPAEPDAPATVGWDSNTRVLAVVLAVALLTALATLLYVFVL